MISEKVAGQSSSIHLVSPYNLSMGPSAKNCEICVEMSLTPLPAQHHYHCHSFRPTAKLPKLSLLFLEAGCFQKHCHLLAEARTNYISE